MRDTTGDTIPARASGFGVESSRCEIATGGDRIKGPSVLQHVRLCACLRVCVGVQRLPFRGRYHKQKATPSLLRGAEKNKRNQTRQFGSPNGFRCRSGQSAGIFFPYTLLPLQGKATRPGVVDRNYDLDARCVCVCVCLVPPSKPRDGPASSMPHAPYYLLHCPCQQPNAQGVGDYRPVRCGSGRHHSAA